MVARICVALVSLLLFAGFTSADDSIEACQGIDLPVSCSFRLPSVSDGVITPDTGTGAVQTGTCQIKDGVQRYCRAVPSQDALDACYCICQAGPCGYSQVGLSKKLHSNVI